MTTIRLRQPSDALIAVAGNIGAGKSTLVAMYAQARGAHAVFEPYVDNPFLADFYTDMPRWGFATQVHFLTRRVGQLVELAARPGLIVQDRSLYEDAEIFARNLYGQGHLSERERTTYCDLYSCLSKSLRRPHVVVYLRAGAATLQRRIAERGRSFERDLAPAYLAGLNELYEAWIASFTQARLVVVDADRLDFVADQAAFDEVKESIDAALDELTL